MKAPKVRVYIRIRRPDGVDAYADPAWNRNRSLRGGYAVRGGRQEYHPEGIYYLRYARCGKRVWDSVGKDPDLALTALRNVEHSLTSIALGRAAFENRPGIEVPAPVLDQTTLEAGIATYMAEIRVFKAPKTISACDHVLAEFAKTCKGKLLQQVTCVDLLNHMSALKAHGLGDRSLFNHVSRINTFLKANGLANLLRPSDWPKFDQKEVDAYHADELSTLFSRALPNDRLLFHFFMVTGFREQEVMYCSWGNVDFRGKIITVRSKPELGFRVKDKEERSVPIPDTLIDSLLALKRRNDSGLIFSSKDGKPDGHMLRRLQKLALSAGLNCGECVTKSGNECSDNPVCRGWGLHKFRRTFATMHSEASVSAPTIQRWLGHADLSTTLRYLAVADMRSDRTRAQVNSSFAAMAIESAT